ncbi:MAG: TonB-dependent receptor [bacterium]|nr:TonB-dependent receptor [bacterium]
MGIKRSGWIIAGIALGLLIWISGPAGAEEVPAPAVPPAEGQGSGFAGVKSAEYPEGGTAAPTGKIIEKNPDVGEPSIEVEILGRKPISKDKTEDSTQVSGQKLRDSPRPSTLEALSQEAADVYVSGRGAMHGVSSGASGGIHIRGFGGSPNSQVLMVEDGVPDYQGIFGHPIPDAYVPFLIDEVLVIKGGDSVLYGTNAMGGAILIRNRWREREGYEFLDDSAFGSYSTLRESLSMLGRSGPWDTAAAFTALSTQGHRKGMDGDETIGEAAVQYRRPDYLLAIRDKLVHLDGADPGPATHPTPDHRFDVWRNNASINITKDTESVHLTAIPYINFGVHRLYDGFYSRDYVGGGKAEADWKIRRSVEALIGLATEQVEGKVKNRISDEKSPVKGSNNTSLYHQLSLWPVGPITLVLGAREFWSSKYGFAFLYKAGGRWEITDGLFLRARVARNFRQPTIRELYLPFPTANPALKPEFSRNWDFGGGWESGRLEISCMGYVSEADNLIKYFGVWPSAEVVNIDHITIPGVEASVGLKRLGPVSLFITGDWQDIGRYTRQNPDGKLDFTLEAGKDFSEHFLGGSLSGEWVHGLYMADYSRQPINDVFTMDLAFRYRYDLRERGLTLEPYLFLRNFLDRKYAYIKDYPMPGFNILIGLKMEI